MQYRLDLSQRWDNRRSLFVPPETRIDPSQYGVEPISRTQARDAVSSWHYSGSCPVPAMSVGLFKKTGVEPARLVGVAVFGMPISNQAITHYSRYAPGEGLELTRYVLTSEAEFNAETFFLSRALAALREARPELKVVLSYSDPTPRTALDGSVVFAGHIGQVYCASNAHYCGRSAPRRELLTPTGQILSSRTLSKVRSDTAQAASAERLLVEAGAPPRRPDESRRDYAQRVETAGPFRSFRKQGNHVYLFPMTAAVRRELAARAPTATYPTKLRQHHDQLRATPPSPAAARAASDALAAMAERHACVPAG